MSTATQPKKFKAKKFRVATEGATTDGRNIERSWIEQMAANYDPKKYGARVWMEHLRGLYPDSTFRAYGDVTALEAEKVEDGKLALFATIEPLPDLVAMTTKAKQKIYTSIEVNPKFADTGEAYLTGLAVTDSPASLGTEVLSFAAQNPKSNPFSSRKSSAECLFSAAEAVDMSFEQVADDTAAQKFSEHLKALVGRFSSKAKGDDDRFAAVTEALEAVTEQFGVQAGAHAATAKALEELQAEFTKLQGDHAELVKKLDSTDGQQHRQRPPATGGNTAQQTDC
ncbi:MAG: GPO family capsid scaffolding protein [Pseudomonadota bacterium]